MPSSSAQSNDLTACLSAGCGQAHCDELKGNSVEQALYLLKKPDYSAYIPTDGRYPPVPAAASVGSTVLADALGRAAHAQHKAAQAEAQLKAKAARVVQGAVKYQAPDRAAVLASLATMNREVNNLDQALTALQASLSLKPDQASQDLHQQLSGMKSTAQQKAKDVNTAVKQKASFDASALAANAAASAHVASAQAASAKAASAKAAGAVDQLFNPFAGGW